MRAILLSAGKGKRLRPLTKKIPKCLVKIKKKTLIDIWLNDLISKNKVEKVLVNTHYLNHQVVSHLKKNKHRKKIKIIYEKKLKGTGGTLMDNLEFFKQSDGILLHCDNYCKEGLRSFISNYKKKMPKGCLISMFTFRTNQPEKCGIVKINKKKIVIKFKEKTKNNLGNLANGAIYILSKKFINLLKRKKFKAKNFSTDIIPKILNKIYTYETKKFFIDIGTIKNLKRANNN